MNLLNQALVVAHFHKDGKLRTDTLSFLESCRGVFKRLIFVSTNLTLDQRLLMPSFVECHVRENIGYDFFSYRLGMQALFDGRNESNEGFTWVNLMNTSFIISDHNNFIKSYFYDGLLNLDADFAGLTMHASDGVVYPHLQSFLLSFSKKVLNDDRFISWWDGLIPIDDKDAIIQNYEIGISRLMDDLGYRSAPIYQPITLKNILDPMHGSFPEILEKFGVLKIGLFKNNPFRLNLEPLILRAQLDEKFRVLLVEGLGN